MGTFTVSTQYAQNIYLIVDYSISQRDGQPITLRDGTTQVTIALGGVTPTDSDADVTDWLFQVYKKGGTVSSARQTLVHNLVAGLKSDAVWSKLDRLWLFAAENQASALTDLVVNAVASPVAGPAFTVDRGYQGNGSTSYVETNYNPTSNGVNYTQNSAHFSAWETIAKSFSGNIGVLVGGGVAGNDGTLIIATHNDSNAYGRINDASASGALGVPSTALGHWLANRTGSSTSNLSQNGAVFGNPNAASGTIINNTFHVGGNLAGPNYSDIQFSMASMGGGLTATDITNFHNRLRTYMNAVGIYDPTTNAWAAQVVANGGTVSAARKALVDALIVGLRGDGVLAKLDRLWLFAAENSQSALVDLVAASTATATGSPTFTTDRGYAGNGTTSYVNTNFNPVANGVNYTLNACSFGGWDRTNRASAGGNAILGVSDSPNAPAARLQPFTTDAGGNTVLVLTNSSSNFVATSSQSNGFWGANRSASNAVQIYLNGSSQGSGTTASVSMNNFPFFIGGVNRANIDVQQGSTDQIAAAFMGGNLSSTDHSNLYTRLQTYMTAVGA